MPNFLSSPATVNPPGTFNLRKPRLAKPGIPRSIAKFTQPSGVPHMPAVQKPRVKMLGIQALAPHMVPQRLPKIAKF